MKERHNLNLLYIGNKLYKQKGIQSVMEVLSVHFAKFANVTSVTDKKSILGKIFDISYTLFRKLKKIDFVLIDVFSTKAFYFALWASFICYTFNKKYILNLHGGNLPNRYLRSKKLFDFILRKAHQVTAPSAYLEQNFLRFGYSVILIPNPINLDHYKSHVKQTDSPIILYLRGYGEIYQPKLLIESMSFIVKHYPDSHLYMFGNDLDGGKEKCICLINHLTLQDNVTISGPQPKSVWLETAKICNLFISVPKIDNTPVSVLEAMALGIPIISTKVGGIKWIIENELNGLFVEQNSEDIANKVLKLFSDKLLYQRISKNGLDYVKMHDIRNIISKWKLNLVPISN